MRCYGGVYTYPIHCCCVHKFTTASPNFSYFSARLGSRALDKIVDQKLSSGEVPSLTSACRNVILWNLSVEKLSPFLFRTSIVFWLLSSQLSEESERKNIRIFGISWPGEAGRVATQKKSYWSYEVVHGRHVPCPTMAEGSQLWYGKLEHTVNCELFYMPLFCNTFKSPRNSLGQRSLSTRPVSCVSLTASVTGVFSVLRYSGCVRILKSLDWRVN